MNRLLRVGTLTAALIAGAAFSGPVTDFEQEFRQMYGTYRAALFSTNSGDVNASAAAMGAMTDKLSALLSTYRDTPPPQYVDDPLWSDTLGKVESLVTKAGAEIAAGSLAEAHETLEGVRDLFGDLHARNSIETFSDRMNAYHAEMEDVLSIDTASIDAAVAGELRERAAVLKYLARDVLSAPPPDAIGNDEFKALAGQFQASVDSLLAAARSGEADAMRAAISGLKAPYSKLFLKFG